MTITYDPKDAAYHDEGDFRAETERVFDLCSGCRLCWNLCPSFGSLFDIIDEKHDGAVDHMTHVEQDRIVEECYQCKLCYVKCPYVPPHEWQLDFPRLMLRGYAVQHKQHGSGLVDQFLGRTDLMGKMGSLAAPIANAAAGKPGSLSRKVMEKTIGIAAQRILPTYAGQRFSSWFKKRSKTEAPTTKGNVAIFQTCMVEYQNPAIGRDTVAVYERNGIACDVPDGTVCCGMPWLDSGNIDAFMKQAEKNVAILAEEVRAGKDIVVPQPTCGYVLKKEYPDYVGSEDARLVGANTYDVCEYLMRQDRQGGGLDTDFVPDRPQSIALHVPCHLKAKQMGLKSRDLLKMTGAEVTLADHCSGIDGTWGMRAKNYDLARKVAQPLKNAIVQAEATVVAGDCHLANGAILEETGQQALHPIQVFARCYGIPEEE